MASTSQGLAHPERAEVAAGASSVAAHCSAFATGKELGKTSTSQVAHPEHAKVAAGASSVAAQFATGKLVPSEPGLP
jgi:hypothetical protein